MYIQVELHRSFSYPNFHFCLSLYSVSSNTWAEELSSQKFQRPLFVFSAGCQLYIFVAKYYRTLQITELEGRKTYVYTNGRER